MALSRRMLNNQNATCLLDFKRLTRLVILADDSWMNHVKDCDELMAYLPQLEELCINFQFCSPRGLNDNNNGRYINNQFNQ